jgi:DNA-binding transcriptional MerR regulator
VESPEEIGLLRIGQLSRRSGVSDHLLRAWESRYGLLRPVRSAGGFRLYSAADEDRVRRMRTLIDSGRSAAQAATAALAQHPTAAEHLAAVAPPTDGERAAVIERATAVERVTPANGAVAAEGGASRGRLEALRDELRAALDGYDESTAQAVFDRLFAEFSLTAVLREVVIPYLHDLGDRWRQGTATVAQEHFASNIIHGRLSGLARGWGSGGGPRALLACPADEHHDLALLAFGVVLSRSGWRVGYLGASTPVAELIQAAAAVTPALTVVAATTPERFEAVADELTTLAERTSLAIAGAGAWPEFADRIGAVLLDDDPVSAAERLGRQLR